MGKSLKIAHIGEECVACGCCVQVCKANAIYIHRGSIACLKEKQCIGCGKCAKECPAAVITITERGGKA